MSDLTDLRDAVERLIGLFGLTRDQLALWVTSPADGGPNGDGMIPLTLADGVTQISAPSPAKILAQADATNDVLTTGTISALVEDRVYKLKADLFAVTDQPDGTYALVTFATDPEDNGLWVADAAAPDKWVGPSDMFGSAIVARALAAVQPLADAAEAAAETLGAAAPMGAVATNMTGQAGGVGFIEREALLDQPRLAVDMAQSASTQLFTGLQSNPAGRFSSAVVDGKLRLTNVAVAAQVAGVASEALPLEFGQLYLGRIKWIDVPTPNTVIGAVCGVLPAAPDDGGAQASIPSNSFVALTYRAQASMIAYLRDAATVASGVTYSGSGVAWAEGAELTYVFEPTNEDCSEAELTWFLNGVKVSRLPVTGLPANGWLMSAVRFSGNGSEIAEFDKVQVRAPSAKAPRTLHVVADTEVAAAERDGSENKPFATLAELQLEIELDSGRRDIAIVIEGKHTDSTLQLDADRFDSIELRGVSSIGGEVPEIQAAIEVGGGWTQIGTSPYWYHDDPGYVGDNPNYGGWIDVTAGAIDAFGRTGGYVVTGRKIYNHLISDIATANALFVAGSYSKHTTGTWAGKWVMRCYGDVDPNTRTWMFSRYRAPVEIVATNTFQQCQVRVSGIHFGYGFIEGLRCEGVHLIKRNARAYGTLLGSGFELNHCDGESYDCEVEGTAFDNVHASAENGDPPRPCKFSFFGMRMLGASHLPHGDGDNASNHRGHEWSFHQSEFRSAGKDGFAGAFRGALTDCVIDDAVQYGVELIAYADIPTDEVYVEGGQISNCVVGIAANPGALEGVTRIITAKDVHIEGSTQAHLKAYQEAESSLAKIVHKGCTFDGATPSQSEISVAPGAAIEGVIERLPKTGAATYNPPSLANGARATTTLAVTGAQLGDEVTVGFGADLLGVRAFGYVSAAGTVTIVFENTTGATVDLPSARLTATARRLAMAA